MRRRFLLDSLISALLVALVAAPAGAQSAGTETQTAAAPVTAEIGYEDAITSKLFFAPTGRSIRRGEAYVAVDNFFLVVAQVGVTDRFSIGVGRPLLWNTTWVTPKFQVYNGPRTAVATGVLHLFAPGFGTGGVGYGVATIGSPDDAFTAGLGWFYGKDGDGAQRGTPVLILGGEHRMGRRSKLVTENYLFEDGAVFSVGSRLLGHRTSLEFGGMFVVAGDMVMPGLIINVVVHARR